ncbi:MAG: M20/M25/M40 family metallo-hydrolase [Candidatus Aminicenantes bacterium]|nr:M20/M25/M40 family metallo-hydrolase [Candidatus Aminicenantes bacterium]
MKYKRFVLSVAVFLLILLPVLADEPENVMKSINAGDIFELNKILASPDMKGRLSGTDGYDKAAKWTAAKFKRWRLKPVYGKDFLQPFEVGYNEMRETHFSVILPPKDKEEKPQVLAMEIYKDFCPTLYGGFGQVEADVVFVGFGLTAPELGWDDYRDIDVKGKIVATLHGTPQIEGKDFSKYVERQPKLDSAVKHEAAGLILINRAVVSGSGNYMEGLPMVMVGDKVANLLFKPKGYDIQSVKALLRDGNPLSFETGVKAMIHTIGAHHDKALTFNVVGMLEGSDPELRNEYIIFGGHLDSMGPWPVVHPGASDNASGSAVVMGLAHAFSRLKKRPKRSIVFALFAAEETGLRGSKHMASNLPEFPSKPILMSNHDMNGVGTSVYVAGGKTYPELYEIILKVNAKYKINENISGGTISHIGGNSDYVPFMEKKIPALSTWVRGGQRYGIHTKEDSIYVITPKIMEDIVRLYFVAGYQFANK